MVRKITDFVYVIEHEEAANNVVIIGKNGAILVDTSLFPEKARAIAKFVRELTAKPITLVMNTHYHPDHTLGNIAFDCPIVAHSLTRRSMSLFNEDYLRSLGINITSVKLPDIIFDNKFEYEDGIRIEFYHGPGHTPDSSYVYIPSEGVLITGDTVVTRIHPEIVSDSNLNLWIKTLQLLPKAKHVIPGHGPSEDFSCVELMIDYLETIKRLLSGEIGVNDLEKSKNFYERTHPELLNWSIKNLIG
uniref:MBL fold metallo-hydrolase n=1 Tax=Fervidobacterium thailandense TaxID=1008305 RepID=A0A7C4RW02_9BACT